MPVWGGLEFLIRNSHFANIWLDDERIPVFKCLIRDSHFENTWFESWERRWPRRCACVTKIYWGVFEKNIQNIFKIYLSKNCTCRLYVIFEINNSYFRLWHHLLFVISPCEPLLLLRKNRLWFLAFLILGDFFFDKIAFWHCQSWLQF